MCLHVYVCKHRLGEERLCNIPVGALEVIWPYIGMQCFLTVMGSLARLACAVAGCRKSDVSSDIRS